MIRPTEIIEILESDPKILSFTTEDNVPLWYMVRYDIFLAILNNNNKLSIANAPSKIKPSIVKTVLFSVLKSPVFIKKQQIVFFNSGVTNVKNTNDNKFFNRVTDSFFIELQSQALLIEDTVSGELRLPRIHNKVYPHLSLILLSKISGLFRKPSKKLAQSIITLITYITEKLDTYELSFNKSQLSTIINDNVLNFHKRTDFYHRFLKWKKPKLIFLEDASYGSRLFILLNAKKLNIPVVELQHGFINEEHFAYRLGSGIENDDLNKLFYPDYYFAYGKFWAESINIPSKVVIIGNPYLEKQLTNSSSAKPEQSKTILFLSSAVAFSEAIEFLLKLKIDATEKGYRILFRPHPLELDCIDSRYNELKEAGVEFSMNSPLYNDFSLAEIIVGELSTALFESMALKDKKQFLLMTSYTNSYYNDKIKIPQITKDNISFIFDSKATLSDKDYFWAEKWHENFNLAIKKILK